MSNLPYAEVIGDPIGHSKSPAIHNHWIERLGIKAHYDLCLVRPGDVADYIAERRADPLWRGCNVTMPHKQAIIASVDRLDPLARKIGAVNTVVREADGKLAGYNTDVPGFLEPLQSELARHHHFRMARIIGTGGAARAIIIALLQHNMTLVVAGRDQAKARALLDELDPGDQHHVAPLGHFANKTDFAFDDREGCFDLVVNASALGMDGQANLRFDISHVPPGSIVYDIVTVPRETPLLKAAQEAGFRTIDGFSMLIGQAASAFELFFGASPPRDDNDAHLRRILER